MKLTLTVDYEIEDAVDSEAEEIADEVIAAEARKFTAVVIDELEARGLKDIQLSVDEETDP